MNCRHELRILKVSCPYLGIKHRNSFSEIRINVIYRFVKVRKKPCDRLEVW